MRVSFNTPTVTPLTALGSTWGGSGKGGVRLAEQSGLTFVDAQFDHAPADLFELLSQLDDLGWRPAPEEVWETDLTPDGDGARRLIRHDSERKIGEY